MKRPREYLPLVGVGLLLAGIYCWTAVREKTELNLSVTAGGQYPYYQEARRMAEAGITQYMGDRNRMPLAPFALSLVSAADQALFFQRGTWFAIVSSLLLLSIVGVISSASLPPWPAIAIIGIAAVHIFLPKAAFVQAELAYYAFFFAAWLLMCRVIARPRWQWALLAGLAAALAYYSKASALPLIVLFVAVMGVRALAAFKHSNGGSRSSQIARAQPRQFVTCALTVLGSFVLLASPYLLDNHSRFGRYFYNVNSTFFMWMDSWAEAQRFAGQHDIQLHYPELQPDEVPSAARYLKTHTWGQISHRLWYGVSTLAGLAIHAPYCKYFIILLCGTVFIAISRRSEALTLLREHAFAAGFTLMLLFGYGLAYSWYAVVSYGDRFILSLYLPTAFSLMWACARMSTTPSPAAAWWNRRSDRAMAWAIVALVLTEGAAFAIGNVPRPNEHFVEFYFNESREAQLAGDTQAAIDGYRGVLRLDPAFAPAHHELAIRALKAGRAEEAALEGRSAVDVEPNNANYLNTYGSALIQGGKAREAVEVLQKAVLHNPGFGSAWYNLGYAYHLAGDEADAERVIVQLEQYDPQLADALRRQIAPTP